jgi:hypothetical protein
MLNNNKDLILDFGGQFESATYGQGHWLFQSGNFVIDI